MVAAKTQCWSTESFRLNFHWSSIPRNSLYRFFLIVLSPIFLFLVFRSVSSSISISHAAASWALVRLVRAVSEQLPKRRATETMQSDQAISMAEYLYFQRTQSDMNDMKRAVADRTIDFMDGDSSRFSNRPWSFRRTLVTI